MKARSQNVCLNVFSKLMPYLRMHKIHLNTWWSYSSHASGDIKFNMCWPDLSYANQDTECISSCIDETHPMPVKIKKCISPFVNQTLLCLPGHKIAHQLVLTKSIQCQWKSKMHLNMCWPEPSHAIEHSKRISTCVDQIPPMPASTHNISRVEQAAPMSAGTQHIFQLVLTKSIPCQRGNTEWISTCHDQTHFMPARIRKGSHNVLTKHITNQRAH